MSDAAHRIWNEVWPGVPQEKMREALTNLHPGDRVGPDGAYVVVPVVPTEREVEAAARAFADARGTPSAWSNYTAEMQAALTAAERVRGDGPVLDRERVEDQVTHAACTGWNDTAMEPNETVIRQVTDAIMAHAKTEVDVRRDERERLAQAAQGAIVVEDDCGMAVRSSLADWLRSQD